MYILDYWLPHRSCSLRINFFALRELFPSLHLEKCSFCSTTRSDLFIWSHVRNNETLSAPRNIAYGLKICCLLTSIRITQPVMFNYLPKNFHVTGGKPKRWRMLHLLAQEVRNDRTVKACLICQYLKTKEED